VIRDGLFLNLEPALCRLTPLWWEDRLPNLGSRGYPDCLTVPGPNPGPGHQAH
jgi:hypothetical protein